MAYKIETTLEQDGEVTLHSLPFHAGDRVEVILSPLPSLTRKEQASPVVEKRYPEPLRNEYATLIHKKLHRTMTVEEASRLDAVRTEINRIDREAESWLQWEQQATEVDRELADLRLELVALSDSSPLLT